MKETIRKFKETIDIKSSVFNQLRSHRYFPIILLVVVTLSAACFHIWQRVKVVGLVKDVAILRKENMELLDSKKKIYSDLAVLTTSSRITLYATDTLGLKPVNADQMLTLVRNEEKTSQPDDLELMYSAIKRMAEYAPVITQTRANAGGVDDLELDSTVTNWEED